MLCRAEADSEKIDAVDTEADGAVFADTEHCHEL